MVGSVLLISHCPGLAPGAFSLWGKSRGVTVTPLLLVQQLKSVFTAVCNTRADLVVYYMDPCISFSHGMKFFRYRKSLFFRPICITFAAQTPKSYKYGK